MEKMDPTNQVRTTWRAEDLGIEPEPLMVSLIKYRQKKNRVQTDDNPNLVSSLTTKGKQMPIIDLDFPHHIVKSTTDGHHHLYIDVPMSKWRWLVLMFGLYVSGVVELGYFVWSLRRGANFVRIDGVRKQGERETAKPTHGWFFRLKEK